MRKFARRKVSWLKAAKKDFDHFPNSAKDRILDAVTLAADGEKPEIAKPMKGFGPGVFEIALRYQTDAYRTVYTLEFGDTIWIIHAFKKKSTIGIKTSKQDIELITKRIKHIKELFK